MATKSTNKRKHKRRWILKKSVRMSLASFFMILALVVAAIPAPVSKAAEPAPGVVDYVQYGDTDLYFKLTLVNVLDKSSEIS